MMMSWLSILVFFGIVVLGAAFVVKMFLNQIRQQSAFPHPSELSSESRTALRPLRQAVEAYESAIRANAGVETAMILGNQTRATVTQTLGEAAKMMSNRDVLSDMAKRLEGKGQDSSIPRGAVDKIDKYLTDAAAAVDAITLKVTAAGMAAPESIPDSESELPDLISRLQNVSQSFDEINQTVATTNHE